MIPGALFGVGLWLAYALVAAGAGFLVAAFVGEWRKGELW